MAALGNPPAAGRLVRAERGIDQATLSLQRQ